MASVVATQNHTIQYNDVTIFGLIIQEITRSKRASDLLNPEFDYKANWTTLSSITISKL